MTEPSTRETRTSQALRVTVVGDRWDMWHRFVAQSPAATFAHRASWFDIMTQIFRHECLYLVAEDDRGWRGVLPLVHVRGLLGHFLISLPFMNDGGPIGDAQASECLVAAAVEIARHRRAKKLELRTRSVVPGPVRTLHRKVSVHLALPATVEDLWGKTFKAKLRSQVRKPSKEGMTARVASGAAVAAQSGSALDDFYSVFCNNMRDLGTPVLPKTFFQALTRAFKDDVVFIAVSAPNGAVAGGACCLIWRDQMEITWASTMREWNPLAPNMLLYSTAMEEAIRRGMRVFNFGRSTPGSPTHRFKQQWGGQDVALPWATWSKGDGGDTGESAIQRAAIALWKRLPVAIANRYGPALARQLPW